MMSANEPLMTHPSNRAPAAPSLGACIQETTLPEAGSGPPISTTTGPETFMGSHPFARTPVHPPVKTLERRTMLHPVTAGAVDVVAITLAW